MSEQHLAILDELGVVAALEWLAERTEDRDGVTVELEIVDDQTGRDPNRPAAPSGRICGVPGRPARRRQCRAPRATVDVDRSAAVARDRLLLVVGDDGTGIDPAA